ncbi:GTPase domain-containing protein [Myxococcota bacterium]|nr:GTPase domain-containing protein [Myxococcota bacterium]
MNPETPTRAGRRETAARTVVLSLVAHTNVGKTTLARTLLRRDVGEVFDHAHVTDEAEPFVLLENAAGARVVLVDTPGFGDSARLWQRLHGQAHPVGWLVAQVWDRFADRALFCSQQAVRHVRDESDVVLYLVNASEDPHDAGYVDPELRILGWIGRPVLVLLNQTGVPGDAATRAADVTRWRVALAEHPVVRETLALDAFTRCWVQEGLLFERIRAVLPDAADRELLTAVLARWRNEHAEILHGAVDAMARLLASAAGDAEPASRSAFAPRERRRHAEALARRLEHALADTNDALISGHGLTGEAAEELRIELADVGGDAGAQPWRHPIFGGLVGGAIGGLAADLAHAGLTLGGGMLAGALLGAAGARGLTLGMELLRGEQTPRVAWTVPFLDRLTTDTLLRYLAVAHFGRGGGSYRAREHPATWRAAVEHALAPQRQAIQAAFGIARKTPDDSGRRDAARALVAPLEAATRAALRELYPEAAELLAASSAPEARGAGLDRDPGAAASARR